MNLLGFLEVYLPNADSSGLVYIQHLVSPRRLLPCNCSRRFPHRQRRVSHLKGLRRLEVRRAPAEFNPGLDLKLPVFVVDLYRGISSCDQKDDFETYLKLYLSQSFPALIFLCPSSWSTKVSQLYWGQRHLVFPLVYLSGKRARQSGLSLISTW